MLILTSYGTSVEILVDEEGDDDDDDGGDGEERRGEELSQRCCVELVPII